VLCADGAQAWQQSARILTAEEVDLSCRWCFAGTLDKSRNMGRKRVDVGVGTVCPSPGGWLVLSRSQASSTQLPSASLLPAATARAFPRSQSTALSSISYSHPSVFCFFRCWPPIWQRQVASPCPAGPSNGNSTPVALRRAYAHRHRLCTYPIPFSDTLYTLLRLRHTCSRYNGVPGHLPRHLRL
jgi:hypothetical protein